MYTTATCRSNTELRFLKINFTRTLLALAVLSYHILELSNHVVGRNT
jgi:hypothetical protein